MWGYWFIDQAGIVGVIADLLSVLNLFHFHLIWSPGCHGNTVRVSLLLITACHMSLLKLFLSRQGTEISNNEWVFNHAGIQRMCIFDVLDYIFGLIRIQEVLKDQYLGNYFLPWSFLLSRSWWSFEDRSFAQEVLIVWICYHLKVQQSIVLQYCASKLHSTRTMGCAEFFFETESY